MTKLMRSRVTCILLAAAVAVLVLPLGFSTVRGEQEQQWPIVEVMEEANEHYFVLRREARRQDFSDETLERVVEMQQLMLTAMHHKFPMAEQLEGQEKLQAYVGFKRLQGKLIGALFELEIALMEGRNDDAAELIQQVVAIRAEGHEKYVDVDF